MDVEALYAQVCVQYSFPQKLKDEQKQVMQCILKKKHVFSILPTGFGKSLCYVLPPLMLDCVEPAIQLIAWVVSPLKALMRSQVKDLLSLGVKAAVLEKNSDAETLQGMYVRTIWKLKCIKLQKN
jgi:ATP-dependent DNA helicase RecQ